MTEKDITSSISPSITPPSPKQVKHGRGRPRKLKVSNIKAIDQHNVQTVKTLITQLETAKSVIDQATKAELEGIDPMALLTKCLLDVNASDSETYAFLTQFDVIEPASYSAAMSSEYYSKWAVTAEANVPNHDDVH